MGKLELRTRWGSHSRDKCISVPGWAVRGEGTLMFSLRFSVEVGMTVGAVEEWVTERERTSLECSRRLESGGEKKEGHKSTGCECLSC